MYCISKVKRDILIKAKSMGFFLFHIFVRFHNLIFLDLFHRPYTWVGDLHHGPISVRRWPVRFSFDALQREERLRRWVRWDVLRAWSVLNLLSCSFYLGDFIYPSSSVAILWSFSPSMVQKPFAFLAAFLLHDHACMGGAWFLFCLSLPPLPLLFFFFFFFFFFFLKFGLAGKRKPTPPRFHKQRFRRVDRRAAAHARRERSVSRRWPDAVRADKLYDLQRSEVWREKGLPRRRGWAQLPRHSSRHDSAWCYNGCGGDVTLARRHGAAWRGGVDFEATDTYSCSRRWSRDGIWTTTVNILLFWKKKSSTNNSLKRRSNKHVVINSTRLTLLLSSWCK